MDKCVGIAEIAGLMGWDARNVARLRQQGKLPEPDQELAMGPIWRQARIVEWMQANGYERPSNEPQPLYERITLAERICAEYGLQVSMTAKSSHGQPAYSGAPRPHMADRQWALYARDPETSKIISLGTRHRPPSENHIRRQIERLLAYRNEPIAE